MSQTGQFVNGRANLNDWFDLVFFAFPVNSVIVGLVESEIQHDLTSLLSV